MNSGLPGRLDKQGSRHMQESRSLERRDLIYYPRVLDRNTGQLLGHVANISPEGLMLIGERLIEPNTTFQLRMYLPVKIGGRRQLELEANSRWSGRNGNRTLFSAGFKLNNVAKDELDIIERLGSLHTLESRQELSLKRLFDVLASFLGLLLLWPGFLCIGLVLKLESSDPIIYMADRIGRFGRLFRMYKFRTMLEPAGGSGPRITAHDDPRITRIGSFLRQTKLNELPQLLNVLKGEMSFVGPRPEDAEFVARYTPEQREILGLRPGITSLASILYVGEEQMLRYTDVTETYLRSILPDKLRLDLIYVRSQSMLLDIDILLQTVLVLTPRFRRVALNAEDILVGPLRKARRFLPWVAVDAVVAVLAIGMAGAMWRSTGPLDVGFGRSLIAAILMTGLFLMTNWLAGTLRVEWRYASPVDAIGVIGSAFVATLLIIIGNSLMPAPNFPLEMLIVTGFFAMGGFLAARYHRRLLWGARDLLDHLRMSSSEGRERVLIVGAGDAGQLTAWLLRYNPAGRAFHLVGIVDDDLDKLGTIIHRVPVLGVCDRMGEIVHEKAVTTIIFAIHSIEEDRRQTILNSCRETSARVVVVPDLLTFLNRGAPSSGVVPVTRIESVNSTDVSQQLGEAYLDLRGQIHDLAELARKGDLVGVSEALTEMDVDLRAADSKGMSAVSTSRELNFLEDDAVIPHPREEAQA